MLPRASVIAPGLALIFACSDRPVDRSAHEELASPRFTEVSEAAELTAFAHETGAYGSRLFPETMGGGVAFLDYDNDGYPDLLVVGGGTWPEHGKPVRALWLFRNNQNGTFSDVTDETGLGDVVAYGLGLAVADVDGDGYRDFLLTTVDRNLLFMSEPAPGGRRFTEAGVEAGLGETNEWSTSAAFFLADADPYPDLYVGNYVPWSPETDRFCSVDGETKSYCTPLAYDGIPGRFYRNNGDGTFSEATETAGFSGSAGKSLGVLPIDYDVDGWTDLVVTNDALRDLLYRNNGDGTFTEVGLIAGIAFDERGRARAGMGVDAGVIDDSGHETVFIGNFSNEFIGVYRYSDAGMFEERSTQSGIGPASRPTLTFGLALLDADKDGYLDVFAANGHVQDDIERGSTNATYRQSPHLFLNDGSGSFHDALPALGGDFAMPRVLRGAAVADYDRDGDVDVAAVENGGRLLLFRNDTGSKPFVQVHPEADGFPDALGARLELFTSAGTQVRFIRTAHSYLSASEAVASFSLPAGARIDSLWVTWHGGCRETFYDLSEGVRHRIAPLTCSGSATTSSAD